MCFGQHSKVPLCHIDTQNKYPQDELVLKRSIFTFYEVTGEGLCLAVFLFRQWSLHYGNSAGWEIREVSDRYYLGTVWIKSESMGLFDVSIFIFPVFWILL